MDDLPRSILSMPLTLVDEDFAADKIPRKFLEDFNIHEAQLGGSKSGAFLAAVARKRPTVLSSRALVRAIAKVDTRPVVICSYYINSGMMHALASEGIAYIRDGGNAYLPFAGVAVSPVPSTRAPQPLSPQAQRMFINLFSGRWNGLTAGELSQHSGMSRASVTGYIAEIEAVLPTLVSREWKRRVLRNPGIPKDELLSAFEPYLVTPVKRRHLLAGAIDTGIIGSLGGLISGETALAYYTDLAHDPRVVRIAMDSKSVEAAQLESGDNWKVAQWFEDPCVIIEEWSYPIDGKSEVSFASQGLCAIDRVALYVELMGTGDDDVRLADAIGQIREEICR